MGLHARIILASYLFFLSIIAGYGLAQIEIIRNPVSAQAYPGNLITFNLILTVSGTQEGVIVTETIPAGWSVQESSPPVDKISRNEIKWLFTSKRGVSGKEIIYSLVAPASVQGSYQIEGNWKSIESDGDKRSGIIEPSMIQIVSSGPEDSGPGEGQPESSSSYQTIVEENMTGTQQSLALPCLPETVKCDGKNIIECTTDGLNWIITEVCKFGCENGVCMTTENQPEKNTSKTHDKLPSGITGSFLFGDVSFWGAVVILVIIVAVIVSMAINKSKKRKSHTESEKEFRYEFRPVGSFFH